MAKLDKSQYTKEQWKIVRDKRRQEKKEKALAQERIVEEKKRTEEWQRLYGETIIEKTPQNYVMCLKHGSKYSHKYVNTLYSMVKRNLTIPHKFVCLTDDPKGIDKDIKILPLPKELTGWWCKPYMYSADLPLAFDSTILYMDLDVVISGNLNKLFEYETNNWCVIRDFTRAMQPKWEKYNSSVVRFKLGELRHVWEDFIKDPKKIIQSHFGDQDWLWTSAKGTAKTWPDEWIQSWKWEIRKDRSLASGPRHNRKFSKVEEVEPPSQCCICVFHGDPNPHNCDDPWVRNNWS